MSRSPCATFDVSGPWYRALFGAEPVLDEHTDAGFRHLVWAFDNGTLFGIHQHDRDGRGRGLHRVPGRAGPCRFRLREPRRAAEVGRTARRPRNRARRHRGRPLRLGAELPRSRRHRVGVLRSAAVTYADRAGDLAKRVRIPAPRSIVTFLARRGGDHEARCNVRGLADGAGPSHVPGRAGGTHRRRLVYREERGNYQDRVSLEELISTNVARSTRAPAIRHTRQRSTASSPRESSPRRKQTDRKFGDRRLLSRSQRLAIRLISRVGVDGIEPPTAGV